MQNNQKVLMLGGGMSSSLLFRLMASSMLVPANQLTDFDINDVEAALALDFAGGEYVIGGSRSSFSAAFAGSSPLLEYAALSSSTMTDSSGNMVTVSSFQPRVGHHVYDGYSLVNEGLLLESEARTNLEAQSNPASPTTWNTNNLDYSGQTLRITGPDGVADSMFKLQERASNTGHYFFASTTVPVGTITFSCIVKDAGDGRFVYFRTNNDGANKYINYNPATASITEVGNGVIDNGVINLGNGFYRIWFSCDNTDGTSGWVIASTNTATPGNNLSNQTFAGTFEAGFYVGFVQVEAGATPSSYIPTSGSTVTRAAQSLVVPAHHFNPTNPTPVGPEVVTNGTFDTDLSNWVDATTGSSTFVWNNGTAELFKGVGSTAAVYQSLSLVEGAEYQLTWDDAGTGGNVRVGTSANAQNIVAITTSKDVTFTAGAANFLQFNCGTNNATAILDNISVRKVSKAQFGWNAAGVSVQMDGRITYADQGIGGSGSGGAGEAVFYLWKSSISNYVETYLGTDSSRTGMPVFNQKSAGTRDFVLGGSTAYSPGTLVPFNISARHGPSFVNGAKDGSAYNANNTPPSLADLSTTDLQIAPKFMGTIKLFRQFAGDIGDDGLEEASS